MALHCDAHTLIRRLHLLALCRLAVQLAHWRCPPQLPAGTGGRLRVDCVECLLLLALLRTLWQLFYQDLHDWLMSWPALALACGLPLGVTGRPAARALSILTAEASGARLRAGGRVAAGRPGPLGTPPSAHLHMLQCRGSGLPLLFLLSPANAYDAPFARPLLTWAVRRYHVRPRSVRRDAGYWGLRWRRASSRASI